MYVYWITVRLFLGRRLVDQAIQDRSIWKDRVLYQAVQKDAKSCGMFVLKVWQLFIHEYYAFCTTITVQQKFWRVQ